jgi:hypothetical protein
VSFITKKTQVINECEGLKMTEGTYNENDNLGNSVQNEYGTDYTVADLSDLKALPDINAWISCMGLQDNQSFNLLRNGQQIYSGNRQYFMQYCEDGNPGSNFLIHDQIGSYIFLGSWTGKRHVLAKKISISQSGVILFDDFENYEVGSFPSEGDWQIKYNGAGNNQQYITDQYQLSGEKSFHLHGVQSWGAQIINELDYTPSIVYFETSFFSESVNNTGVFGLRNPNLGT